MKKAKQLKSKAKSMSKPKVVKAKSTKKPSTKKKLSNQKVLLVYGYGEDALPRAGAFTDEHKLARKAAGLLGLSIFIVPASDVKALANRVKAGNVYASGDGFTPKIPQKRFEELLTSLKLTPLVPPVPTPTLPLPTSWQKIEPGQLLLAPHDDPALGYWECVVVEALDGDALSLQARDFPEVAPIKRSRFAVALLHTADFVVPENPAEVAPGLPTDWNLRVGHLVLACLGPREGWYPAVVTARDEDKVTLHWQGEPSPTFTRPLPATALLYPKAP